jgi:ankyrin repeat protein
MYASSAGFTHFVDLLIKHGTNLEAKTDTGVTSLLLAANNRRDDVVELLLEAGADINPIFALNRTSLLNDVPGLKTYVDSHIDVLTPENLKKWKSYRLMALFS